MVGKEGGDMVDAVKGRRKSFGWEACNGGLSGDGDVAEEDFINTTNNDMNDALLAFRQPAVTIICIQTAICI